METKKTTNNKQRSTTKRNARQGSSSKRPNTGKANSKFSNDPAWYSVDPSIMRDAASIPYSIPAGAPLNFRGDGLSRIATIPGVMAYEIAPTVGYCSSPTDPINIAATQSYAFIRHANSGSANYDASDIMLYYLAMADVFSYIEYLRRMYGVVQVYAQRNKYLPYTILKAMKVQPQSLINNMANFRLGLNMLINKAASFAVPNTMSLFPRRQFLYSGLYTEGTSIRDQIYMFVPNGFHLYNWKEGKTDYMTLTNSAISEHLGYQCTPYDEENVFSAMDLVQIGHAMVDLLINNEEMGIMNGDIIKAYGDNILKLSHLSEDYAIAPVYDPYVLEQMQNATIMPYFGTGENVTRDTQGNLVEDGFTKGSLDIVSSYTEVGQLTEGMPVLISKPMVTLKKMPLNKTQFASILNTNLGYLKNQMHVASHLITTQLPEPEAKDNMEITRLTGVLLPIGENANEAAVSAYKLSCGTEVCVGCVLFARPFDNTIGTEPGPSIPVDQFTWDTDVIDAETFKEASGVTYTEIDAVAFLDMLRERPFTKYLTSFKHRPTTYYYTIYDVLKAFKTTSTIITPAPRYACNNTSNYTVLDNEVLDRLHSAAVMSEFATPHIAIKQ